MGTSRQENQLAFQNQNRKNYFEGWYFKQVSRDETVVLSLIPSMMRNENTEKAMLQIILAEKIDDKWNIQTEQIDFDMSSFSTTKSPFSIGLGKNTFSKKGVYLEEISIGTDTEDSKDISCKISFEDFTLLPTSRISPTIMGIFSYLPFMECIHGIGSIHHILKGYVKINEKTVSFDGGIGYLEKDWGESFPKDYIWLQSNHFVNRPSCLFFSWANIPLGPLHFKGFICHIWVNGKHYRFATYNYARCIINGMNEDSVSITLEKGDFILNIEATVDMKGTLSAPKFGQMDHQIKEGLAGTVSFKLINEKTGEMIEDSTELAGVEIVKKLEKNIR